MKVTSDSSVVIVQPDTSSNDGCGCGTIVIIVLLLYIISLLRGC